MNFCFKAAFWTSKGFIRRIIEAFLRSSRCTSMHYGTVNHDAFHVGIIGETGMYGSPYAFITPSNEAFVYTVPSAPVRWQQSPRRTTAKNPKDCFNKHSAGLFRSNIDRFSGFKKYQNFVPNSIRKICVSHRSFLQIADIEKDKIWAVRQISTEPNSQ